MMSLALSQNESMLPATHEDFTHAGPVTCFQQKPAVTSSVTLLKYIRFRGLSDFTMPAFVRRSATYCYDIRSTWSQRLPGKSDTVSTR